MIQCNECGCLNPAVVNIVKSAEKDYERKVSMGKALWRLVRVAVATGAGAGIGVIVHDPRMIWIAPVLSALAKYLRDKHPNTYNWLPL